MLRWHFFAVRLAEVACFQGPGKASEPASLPEETQRETPNPGGFSRTFCPGFPGRCLEIFPFLRGGRRQGVPSSRIRPLPSFPRLPLDSRGFLSNNFSLRRQQKIKEARGMKGDEPWHLGFQDGAGSPLFSGSRRGPRQSSERLCSPWGEGKEPPKGLLLERGL